ncbi:MAG: nickel-dependent lactate racemase [Dysgonamonadaceae bacterium]|jgi:nickel-dependent lactate racemase|nr:nickel-dependent lactate racemase [Dysgonamonadaceae bacterium]
MTVNFRYGKEEIALTVPDDSLVYIPSYTTVSTDIETMLLDSISDPVGCLPLSDQLKKRRKGNVVIVVSDITRPIPYHSFLPCLLEYIENEGVSKDEIAIVVATGMHRASTTDEKLYMFGKQVVENYKIFDHDAENDNMLSLVEGKSWSGAEVRLNRHYVEAGFRILTGLVEPHFMAGFSGGRKSICPGLASLNTIQMFHGYRFLNHPNATNTVLEDNPLHLENSSVARLCPADFSINIILDQEKKINQIISGEQFASHEKAIDDVKRKSCTSVAVPADLAITSCGGYPLDDTFYQCVKGFVNCLPALKSNGEIVAFGSCSEGIGSPEYESIMKKYASRHPDFLHDISKGSLFIKDQWQFQMHIRVLEQLGLANLHFYTTGISQEELNLLSVTGHSVTQNRLAVSIQQQVDMAVASKKKIAVFPEGPYCSPICDSKPQNETGR